jgi:arsenate reductase
MQDKKKVLFICTHNSARSQMAEGLLRHMYPDRYEAYSAGVAPTRVHPFAIRAMEGLGIDISGQTSKNLQDYLGDEFDYVITVCDRANESCPIFPGAKEQIHKGFLNPMDYMEFEKVRDQIKAYLEEQFG